MTRALRQIVAMGGGGFSMEPDNPLLDDYVLGLAGRVRPRVCFLPTASGDADGYTLRFYEAFAARAELSVLRLFRREVADLRAFFLDHDVLYVGGGNTINMLAVWRAHGVDRALREAWEHGVVLAGVSAGAVCWFETGVTDSYGNGLAPLRGGLGLLRGSMVPHYDGESLRRPTFHRLLGEGLPAGIAADDGVALHFIGGDLAHIVSSRPDVAAYRAELLPGRGVVELTMPARYLGE